MGKLKALSAKSILSQTLFLHKVTNIRAFKEEGADLPLFSLENYRFFFDCVPSAQKLQWWTSYFLSVHNKSSDSKLQWPSESPRASLKSHCAGLEGNRKFYVYLQNFPALLRYNRKHSDAYFKCILGINLSGVNMGFQPPDGSNVRQTVLQSLWKVITSWFWKQFG